MSILKRWDKVIELNDPNNARLLKSGKAIHTIHDFDTLKDKSKGAGKSCDKIQPSPLIFLKALGWIRSVGSLSSVETLSHAIPRAPNSSLLSSAQTCQELLLSYRVPRFPAGRDSQEPQQEAGRKESVVSLRVPLNPSLQVTELSPYCRALEPWAAGWPAVVPCTPIFLESDSHYSQYFLKLPRTLNQGVLHHRS